MIKGIILATIIGPPIVATIIVIIQVLLFVSIDTFYQFIGDNVVSIGPPDSVAACIFLKLLPCLFEHKLNELLRTIFFTVLRHISFTLGVGD